jgi:hypothetical protein
MKQVAAFLHAFTRGRTVLADQSGNRNCPF